MREIRIELGGRARYLRFDLNAIAYLKEVAGLQVTGPNRVDIRVLMRDPAQLRIVVGAMLATDSYEHDGHVLQIWEAGRLLDIGGLEQLIESMARVMEASSPPVEEGGAGGDPPMARQG